MFTAGYVRHWAGCFDDNRCGSNTNKNDTFFSVIKYPLETKCTLARLHKQ